MCAISRMQIWKLRVIASITFFKVTYTTNNPEKCISVCVKLTIVLAILAPIIFVCVLKLRLQSNESP